MDHLPYGLLLLVASELDKGDILHFRLGSHAFAEVGAEYLNIDRRFYFRKHSLDRLRSIARHPVLRRKLREITFFVDVVPSYAPQEMWEPQAYAVCHTDKSRGKDSLASKWLQSYKLHEVIPLQKTNDDEFRASGWQVQQKIRSEQETLMDSSSTTFEELE